MTSSSPFAELNFTPDQRLFFRRVARSTRDVGYIILASSLFSLMAVVVEGWQQIPPGRTDDLFAWLSSFFNGNRTIAWAWLKQLVIEIPFEVAIGWSLVQTGIAWFAIADQPTHHGEHLFRGLVGLLRVFRLIYIRTVIVIGLIWLFILLT
ncbi:MAG: hypothetical protein ACFBSG_12695 [Leptolyngbyaceae cyanobacterium]